MKRTISAVSTGSALNADRRFELLLDAIKDYAIYLLDADGYVSSWNTGAQRFKGYTSSEIIGQHFSRFYTEEDRAAGLPALALRTARESGRFESEGWRVRKDGTRFWTTVVIDPVLDEDGQVIGYAKITRDITDKKAAQQALYESEQRFRLLVEGMRDYAIYMLDLSGYINNWNAGAQAIKGYVAHEIVGQHFSLFYTQEDREAGLPARALDTARREGRYENEAWRVRKDGSRFWANVVIDRISDESGKLVGFAKITRDITERRLAQEEIDRGREALNHAQKMEAIGQLTGGVAHDFNNLLTIIRSSAELLRRPGVSEEKRMRYIEAIAETAERAGMLTRQLLAFARRQSLRPESFDAGARIRGMEQIIATTVGSPIDVEYVVDGDVPPIEADPNQFDSALLNMVINARDAMPKGGKLIIRIRSVTGVPPVRRHAGTKGDFIAVSVTDTGTGIADGTLARIFEPFFTTKAVNHGTGLGLSQAYGFAKQSGGEIDVATRLGTGTTFTLYLPRAKASVLPAAGLYADADQKAYTAMSVLVVEDNKAVGEFTSGLLTELGQRVTWATDGQSALDTLEANPGAFDIVFSDVVMPGINGIDLAIEIRRRWPALRVILTSGYSHVLAEQGSHGFELLEKPYSIEAVLKLFRISRDA